MSEFDILKTYNKKYYLTHPWEVLFEIKRNIIWAWQRVVRGWDDRVVWSIDSYLFYMLPQWLRQLKEDKHGIPFWCIEATGAVWNSETCEYDNKDFEKAEAHFDYVIDKMIEGFEAGYKANDSDLDVYEEFRQWQIDTYGNEIMILWREDENVLTKTSKYNEAYTEFNMLEKTMDEHRVLNHKLNIALILFCEYHDSLWD